MKKSSKTGGNFSIGHSEQFLKTGGKCPSVILSNFQKTGRKLSIGQFEIWKKEGKCQLAVLSNIWKTGENVYYLF